ncbi:hypothetical protein MDA_GLEAN10020721 [Myotis davidii]|uniref:Uncharacterized protein n=1 Tax=Myotis davidii TaxID=225400 RepID=L5LHE1_MYODS|nr:hypothetical protein MDA_GLEAN10020721 [Myotis davidii]
MSLHLVTNGQIPFEVCRVEMSFQNKAGAPLRKASDERQLTDVQADGPADTCGARAHRHEDQATHYDDMGGHKSQQAASSRSSGQKLFA